MKWIILFASIFRTNNDNLFSQQPLHDKAFDLDDFRESLCLKASREPAGALLRDPSRVFRRLISVEGRSWWRGPDRLRRTVAAPVRICRRRRFRPTEAGVSSRPLSTMHGRRSAEQGCSQSGKYSWFCQVVKTFRSCIHCGPFPRMSSQPFPTHYITYCVIPIIYNRCNFI